MSKYHGKIGFVASTNTSPGIWEDSVIERYYRGNIIQNYRRWENGESINDNLNVTNQISIVADSFAINNLYNMRYVEFSGHMWDISNVSIEHPRIVITIGGVYNGQQAVASSNA